MAKSIGDYLRSIIRCIPWATTAQATVLTYDLYFTTSGAVDTTNSIGAPGVSVTKPAGTGLYRIAYPACKYASVQLTHHVPTTAADRTSQLTAKIPTSGTADFTTLAAGSAANATSGDRVDITITCYQR